MTESPDQRNVRFEQQRVNDSGNRKKSKRQRTVFPYLYPGSRNSSGSALTSSTSTRDSPLRVGRNVAFAPRFLNNSRFKVLFRACPAVVILSAIVLSAALIASLLFAGWRLEAVAVCRSKPCREYARLLADSVNTSLNPCADFTGFVCSGWRRRKQVSVQEEWMLLELNRVSQLLRSVHVPLEHQNALQKSAAFLRSCEAVRNGDLDEMPKVKPALLEAGIVWPLLSKYPDVLHTWLYTSLTLQWSTVLHVSIERYPNITVIFLEPVREFHRIAEKHEQWASDVEQAERYFETLRREFHNVTESSTNETEGTVSFDTTHKMDIMYLPPLQHNTGFLSNYTVLNPAWIFGTVPALTHERWLAELDRNGAGISGDVDFVSTKPGFVRVFLELWKYRGDHEMHLFLSWCTVQTVALYTNRRLLVNFYGRESSANKYHAALCLSKAHLLCGGDLFDKYFQDVISEQVMRVAQRVVADTRQAFASRLERWPYKDDNISVVEDWQSTDLSLGYFHPSTQEEQHQAALKHRSVNATLLKRPPSKSTFL
ncbi:uncharacterized protein LOC119432606 [Dermacentor silvarum]|uniref:uncharacterized protein LOC119432606 n=1 Tax=Dermacentor silvarum TaxID=543639 RepID=UPI0021009426|nr:uncharacterized protein LOC119432606 [Dermacentor silvarum]